MLGLQKVHTLAHNFSQRKIEPTQHSLLRVGGVHSTERLSLETSEASKPILDIQSRMFELLLLLLLLLLLSLLLL